MTNRAKPRLVRRCADMVTYSSQTREIIFIKTIFKDHSGNIQGRVSFTEIPISLFAKIVESIDNDEAVGRMKDNGFKRLLQEIEPDATFD